MGQIQKAEQQLASAKSLKEALLLDFVQNIFVKNFEAQTGRKDGENRFQTEVLALLELANENQAIAGCDRFSFMAALVKAGGTGLSFREGKLYAIPYGRTLKVQISTHGKRELLERMPEMKRIYEGQVVIKGDTFEHDKLNNKVVTHVHKHANPLAMENIIAAYVRLEYKDGTKIDVVVSREEILMAKSKSKAQKGGPWFDFPGEMSKKVAYNRAYKLYYHVPENIVDYGGETEEGEDIDYSVESSTINGSQPDSFMETASGETVSTQTGEVINPLPDKEEKSPNSFMD